MTYFLILFILSFDCLFLQHPKQRVWLSKKFKCLKGDNYQLFFTEKGRECFFRKGALDGQVKWCTLDEVLAREGNLGHHMEKNVVKIMRLPDHHRIVGFVVNWSEHVLDCHYRSACSCCPWFWQCTTVPRGGKPSLYALMSIRYNLLECPLIMLHFTLWLLIAIFIFYQVSCSLLIFFCIMFITVHW